MKALSNNLKKYRTLNGLNQTQMAEIIGVKQGTIANYENGNRTPTIEILLKISKNLGVSVDNLLSNKIPNKNKLETDMSDDLKLISQITDYLVQKDDLKLAGAFKKYYNKCNDIIHIFNHIITPTMYRIGELWEKGQLSIGDEHAATEIMCRIVDWLTIQAIEVRDEGRCAVCLSISPEQHTLGIKMISSYLGKCGYHSIYIGNNLPTNELIEILRREKPELLALSLTLRSHQDSLKNLIKVIRDIESFSSIDIVVGGQGIKDLELIGLNNVHIIKDLDELDLWRHRTI